MLESSLANNFQFHSDSVKHDWKEKAEDFESLDVVRFLNFIPTLQQYSSAFQEGKIDGTMLLAMIEELESEMWNWVHVKFPHRHKIKVHFERFCKGESDQGMS